MRRLSSGRVPEVTEHRAQLEGQPLFYRSAAAPPGGGAPALFLHGVPTSSDDWLPFLTRTGGLAPDLPGFGRSTKRGDGDFTMDGYARFVERFLDLVEVERVQLVVHDWGAAGLVWAQRRPERVERLVVMAAVPLLPGYRWHRMARAWRSHALGELVMGATNRWALARSLPAELAPGAWEHFDQGTQRAILRLYRSSPEDALARAGAGLGRIRCPALVLWPDRDPYIPSRFGEAYAAALPGARLVPLPGAGHWPWIGRPEVVDAVADFLAGRDVPATAAAA
jgi:pimeloyl-ACP methyl ester carboxylesterase